MAFYETDQGEAPPFLETMLLDFTFSMSHKKRDTETYPSGIEPTKNSSSDQAHWVNFVPKWYHNKRLWPHHLRKLVLQIEGHDIQTSVDNVFDLNLDLQAVSPNLQEYVLSTTHESRKNLAKKSIYDDGMLNDIYPYMTRYHSMKNQHFILQLSSLKSSSLKRLAILTEFTPVDKRDVNFGAACPLLKTARLHLGRHGISSAKQIDSLFLPSPNDLLSLSSSLRDLTISLDGEFDVKDCVEFGGILIRLTNNLPNSVRHLTLRARPRFEKSVNMALLMETLSHITWPANLMTLKLDLGRLPAIKPILQLTPFIVLIIEKLPPQCQLPDICHRSLQPIFEDAWRVLRPTK
jgi:hypothetical protein